MFDVERQQYADYGQKPSAIDGLFAQGQISKMTADEYRVLARQARTALCAKPKMSGGKLVTSRRR
jgi:hypothetical protein